MKLPLSRLTATSLLLVPMVTATGTSLAQEGAESAVKLEEILVTATRRVESLQSVPISVSVLGAADIEASRSLDLQDLSAQVPNFVFAQNVNQGFSSMSIRGIYSRADPSFIGFDQSVGVYVDGVYHSRQFNANAGMGDVERVEVLRGPQGTLFGRNTISGAVNITTRKPDTSEMQGKLSLEAGNYDMVHGRGSINIPLIKDKLAIKLFGDYLERDGYVDNRTTGNDNLGNKDQTTARLQVRYIPSEQTTVDFSTSVYSSDTDDYFFEHIEGGAADGEDFTTANNYENKSEVDSFSVSATVEHGFNNDYVLTSITAWLDDELKFQADIEGTAMDVVRADQDPIEAKQFSQEFRILSPADRDYDFVAGVYYDHEESEFSSDINFGPGFPVPPVQGNGFSNGNEIDRESYAAFVHANYHPSEELTLFGGLRYTDETKKLKAWPTVCTSDLTCTILGLPSFTESVDAPDDVTLDDWTWTAGLQYQLRDDIMLYGSVGTGIKAGAFNNTSDPELDAMNNNLQTDKEEVISYELGAKTSWLDNRLTVNLAVFYMDYDDLQVREGCTACGDGGLPINFLSNAADADSQGFELEIMAVPTSNLRLTAGVGYNDAEFGTFENVEDKRTLELVDASGNDVPLSAEWSLNASAEYEMEIAGGTLFSRLGFTYIDERYGDQGVDNHPDDLLPDQSLLNGRLTYRPGQGNWGIAVWGKNLTDDDSYVYLGYSSAFGINARSAQYQEPRTYGVEVDYTF
jgi:iron complex outermembrane recepter protein